MWLSFSRGSAPGNRRRGKLGAPARIVKTCGAVLRRVFLPLLLGALQVSATFAVAYYKDDFDKLPIPAKLASAAGFLLALITPGLAALNAREAREEKLKGDAYTALLVALAKIADKANVSTRAIGLNAYIVRRPLFWPWNPYQARLARVRLSSFPPASTIVWTKGKGFVGECWRSQDMMIDRHIPTLYAAFLGCDEATWNSAPASLRLNLSFAEWQSTQQRYKYIRVAPILTAKEGGRFKYVGCVSMDTGDNSHAAALGTDEVRDLLQNAADSMDAALRSQK
jgi:hypothetical protein